MNPEYRTGTQIITLRAEILNSEGRFVPGMQASVVLTDDNREALTLPVDAVIRGEDGAHVWVKIGEGTFASRMVTTGLETFADVEFLKGLKEGYTVVISRSEENMSDSQSLIRILYAVFCLKKIKM